VWGVALDAGSTGKRLQSAAAGGANGEPATSRRSPGAGPMARDENPPRVRAGTMARGVPITLGASAPEQPVPTTSNATSHGRNGVMTDQRTYRPSTLKPAADFRVVGSKWLPA
jgi:hypothetical protein